MADAADQRSTIPPVWLEPADFHILQVLRERGPTYHINISKTSPYDIHHVSRRCKYLARHDVLDRRSRTYFALTEHGEELLEEAPVGEVDGRAVAGGDLDGTATGG